MNFTDLQAKLSNYGKVKSALPILENILVTDDGEFGRSIAWTDLDNWYKVRTGRITPASIESDSTVLVPRDMYRNNPGAGWQVNLRPDDSGVDMLQYGLSGASMLVPVQDKNEYPILPDIVAIKEKCGRIALKWSDLKPALTWLKKAVSDDLTRLTLCSILVEYQHGHIDLVATNGHVLQKVELATPYQKQAGFIFSARINAAAIKFLLAIPNKAIDLVVFDSYGDADILHIYAPVDLIADNPSGSHCIEIISQ
ncbi:hypothetical protein KAR91_13975, partial [Candidatus Pacearchaeota archaeon]|nr:hypothetical protein [Candidatus Pacearchaeota archaeon]